MSDVPKFHYTMPETPAIRILKTQIKAFIEAEEKSKEPGIGADFYMRHYVFAKAAEAALADVKELVELCSKITTRGRTVDADDMDRIRELVEG